MATSAAVIQLHQRETFEQNVSRAIGAGAVAGALSTILWGPFAALAMLGPLAVAAAGLAMLKGTWTDRVVAGVGGLFLAAAPWMVAGLSTTWQLGLTGAAVGLMMVRARLVEKGQEGSLAAHRPTAAHGVATAALTGGLAVAGTQVAGILVQRLDELQTPELLAAGVGGAVVGLFAGLGSVASHVALSADPVEARAEEVLGELTGEFQAQLARGLALYRQCGEQLAALPRDAAREELARTIQQLTRDASELAADWRGLEAQLTFDVEERLLAQVKDLAASAAAARDVVARRQLEQAAASLGEETQRLGELKLKRERVLAKLKSQVALLERARVALIGMRSSHATVRAAELSAVARKLSALARAQADEARLAHEVATGMELSAAESQAAQAQLEARLAEARTLEPAGVAPVAPVGESSPGGAEAAERLKS